jgi:hypothetical protein
VAERRSAGRLDIIFMAMPKFQLYFETMAGSHVSDAVRALRDAGSADALFDPVLRATDPDRLAWEDVSLACDEAEAVRVTHSRRALLFAAFAAEAYANDFLYSISGGQDRDALQKLPTVDKYALLPMFAGRASSLDRGKEPLQTIRWLFKRRDELVHAAPRGPDLTYDPANHNPREAARCVVAVADAVAALNGEIAGGSIVGYVLAERGALLAYGEHATNELPEIHAAPSPIDLLIGARRRDWS